MAGIVEKIKRRLFVVSVVCLVTGLTSGAESSLPPEIVGKNFTKKFDTEADAVILYEKRSITLEKDGKVKERVRIIQKIITDFGADEFCDPRLRYNARHQKLKIIEASTYMLDGKKIVTGDNGKNLSTPKTLADFPYFTDIQEMIVTHVGVELGGITVLEYEIVDKKPWRNIFYGLERFVDERDIKEKIFEIKVPEGKKLNWKAYNFNPGHTKSSVGGYDVYTFKISDWQGVNLHEVTSGAAMVLPHLFYSEEIGAKDFTTAVTASAYNFGGPLSDEAASDVKEILKNLQYETKEKLLSPLDTTLYIYKRIADWLGDAEVDRSLFGWQSRSPLEAFSSGYADVYEKLGILYSVFSHLGYSPAPILTLSRTGSGIKYHPDNISGLWIKISAHGFYLYLPVKSSSLYGEPRPEKAFVVKKDGLASADFVKPATARVRVDLNIDLRKEPYSFSSKLKFRGKYNPYWNVFLSEGEVTADTIAEEVLGKEPFVIEKASFQRLALNESVIDVSGSVSDEEGEVDIAMASTMLDTSLSQLEIWRQTRETSLFIKEKEIESISINILMPEKGEILYIPQFEDGELQYEFDSPPQGGKPGSMKISRKAKAGKEKVKVSRKVILMPGIVKPANYGKFKEIVSDSFAPNSVRVIINLNNE